MIVIVVVLFCLVSVAIRRMEGSWYSPAAFFALLWTIVIVFSILSAPDYYFSIPALLFIFFNVILFFTGGKLYEIIFERNIEPEPFPDKIKNTFNYRYYIFAGIFGGCVAVVFLILESGSNFYVFFDIKKLMNLSSKLTEERYYGVRLSGITMLGLTAAYFSSFFVGMNLAVKPGKLARIHLILLMIPILTFTLVYTARAVLLFMIIVILACYIAFRPHYRVSAARLFNRFNVLFMVIGVLALFLVFFFSQAARMQVDSFSGRQIEMLIGHLRVWFSGNVSAFSIWFDTSTFSDFKFSISKTFAGLNELLGFSRRKLGIYDVATDVNTQMEFSNIYTLFRFLVDDFGVIGASIVVLFGGGIGRKLYLDGLKSQNVISGALVTGLILMMLWSFVASVFAYNSVLFAWIGFVIILKFEQQRAGR